MRRALRAGYPLATGGRAVPGGGERGRAAERGGEDGTHGTGSLCARPCLAVAVAVWHWRFRSAPHVARRPVRRLRRSTAPRPSSARRCHYRPGRWNSGPFRRRRPSRPTSSSGHATPRSCPASLLPRRSPELGSRSGTCPAARSLGSSGRIRPPSPDCGPPPPQAGLTATPAADGLIVAVAGPAARVERLLHTRLAGVRLADGTLGRHATAPSELPHDLAGAVSTVVGLDDLSPPACCVTDVPAERRPAARPAGCRRREATALRAGVGVPGPRACAAARSDASAGGVLTDDTVASLYGVDGLYGNGADGHGQTIDAYELDPFAPERRRGVRRVLLRRDRGGGHG